MTKHHKQFHSEDPSVIAFKRGANNTGIMAEKIERKAVHTVRYGKTLEFYPTTEMGVPNRACDGECEVCPYMAC